MESPTTRKPTVHPTPCRDELVARLPSCAGGLLAGAIALSGCGPAGLAPREDAAASKAQVLAVSRQLLRRLDGIGRYPKPARGGWTGCDDLGGKVQYRVTGRLDAADGGSTQHPRLVDAVGAELAAAGVGLAAVDPDADPATLRGSHRDVTVQVTGYRTRPVVVLELWGPCLDVGDLDDELLAEPPERLRLG